jgi:hypothetical protein
MAQSGFKPPHGSALNFDFCVFDEVARCALKCFDADGCFAQAVPLYDAVGFDFDVLGGARVDVILSMATRLLPSCCSVLVIVRIILFSFAHALLRVNSTDFTLMLANVAPVFKL